MTPRAETRETRCGDCDACMTGSPCPFASRPCACDHSAGGIHSEDGRTCAVCGGTFAPADPPTPAAGGETTDEPIRDEAMRYGVLGAAAFALCKAAKADPAHADALREVEAALHRLMAGHHPTHVVIPRVASPASAEPVVGREEAVQRVLAYAQTCEREQGPSFTMDGPWVAGVLSAALRSPAGPPRETGTTEGEWRRFMVECHAQTAELRGFTDAQKAAVRFTLETLVAAWDRHQASSSRAPGAASRDGEGSDHA